MGAPTLVLLSRCSWSKALHSGPISTRLSSITRPQAPHTISPRSRSFISFQIHILDILSRFFNLGHVLFHLFFSRNFSLFGHFGNVFNSSSSFPSPPFLLGLFRYINTISNSVFKVFRIFASIFTEM